MAILLLSLVGYIRCRMKCQWVSICEFNCKFKFYIWGFSLSSQLNLSKKSIAKKVKWSEINFHLHKILYYVEKNEFSQKDGSCILFFIHLSPQTERSLATENVESSEFWEGFCSGASFYTDSGPWKYAVIYGPFPKLS